MKKWRERWSEHLVKQGRKMVESDLVSTDIGYISSDNLNYLYELKLLNEDGRATRTKEGDTYTWSKLCAVYDFVKSKLQEVENPKARVTSDDIITCIRLGKVKVTYTYEGVEYAETYKNGIYGTFQEQYERTRRIRQNT
jgi:hypothetical protein